MALKPDVLQAFALLGIDPDTDVSTATKAYKRLALLHHPDRNHGDPQSTQRFQEIGAAWNICQRHFDNPTWSYSHAQASYTSANTYSFSPDDDIPVDEHELHEFYMQVFLYMNCVSTLRIMRRFMFAETLFGRYTRTKGQRYRYERSGGASGGLSTFSGGLAQSQERQARNTERQRKENEEYEKRKCELELEIEQEERERAAIAQKLKADEDRRANALESAFRAASAGDSASVKSAILEYDIDVNISRKRPKRPIKQGNLSLSDSLLHVVAGHCDEELFMFVIERGANPLALNEAQLNPFQVAIRTGNTSVVQYILEHRGRTFDVYHPSKASPSGRTPLKLAIESGVPSVVEILVKYATTHDVERCWKIKGLSEEIKEFLLKKKGFLPPDSVLRSAAPVMSNKSQRQHEIAQEKKARLAEELTRAAINRKRREERAVKRAEKGREEAANKLAQEQARLKAEMEAQQRMEEEAQAKLRKETRLHEEAEQRATASRKKLEIEEKKWFEEKRSRIPEEHKREPHKHSSSSMETTLTLPKATEKDISAPQAVSAEERKTLRYLKMREKRKAKLVEKRQQKKEQAVKHSMGLDSRNDSTSKATTKKMQSLKTVVKDTQGVEDAERQRNEETLRRRAEQSARDKERHRRMVEERAKVESAHNKESRKDEMTRSQPIEDVQTCIVPDDLFRDDYKEMSSRGSGRR